MAEKKFNPNDDRNVIFLRGTVQSYREDQNPASFQIATDGSVKPGRPTNKVIVYIYNPRTMMPVHRNDRIEVRGHLQPRRMPAGSERSYEQIIVADEIRSVKRDIAYVMPDVVINDGLPQYAGTPDDFNVGAFIGSFVRSRGGDNGNRQGQDGERRNTIARCTATVCMRTRDSEGELHENNCSFICYGRQAEYVLRHVKPGDRVAVDGRVRSQEPSSPNGRFRQQIVVRDIAVILRKEDMDEANAENEADGNDVNEDNGAYETPESDS